MKNSIVLFSFALLLALSSCKTQFEKIRTSGTPDEILAQADNYFEQGEWLKANDLYEIVLNSFRGRAQAEKMYFNYSYTFYHLQEYISAGYWFKNFSEAYQNSEYREEASYMVGMSYYQMSPSFRLDQTYSRRAIESFQEFVNYFPLSDRIADCNGRIDELRAKLEQKAFESAELYYKIGDYKAALHSFQNVMIEFPESKEIEKIRYLSIMAAYELAESSYYGKQEGRYQKAKELYDEFMKRHPNSEYVPDLNQLYDKTVKKLNSFKHV